MANTQIVGGIDSFARANFIKDRIQTLNTRIAATILISHISVVSGPNPGPNPPTAISPTISSANIGDATVTISCQTASGRVTIGDSFTIQGIQGIFKITADITSSMDVFTSVPISPTIPANITSVTPITFSWINQQSVQAYIGGAFKTQIEGGTITAVIKITIPVNNLSFMPQVGDRVIFGGSTYLIGNITPMYAYGQPVAYELLVK